MKRALFTLIIALPAAAQDPTTLQKFLRIRTPGAPIRMPDGTMLSRDWPDGVYQLYRVAGSIASPDAPMSKLTTFPDGITSFHVSPDYSRVVVAAAVGGNEYWQLYEFDQKTGKTRAITDNPKAQYAMNAWVGDGAGFLYTGNDESPTDFHIYRYDFSTGKSTKILAKPGSWSAADISSDGSRVLVDEYRSISDRSIYLLDTRSGQLRDLSDAAGKPESTAAINAVGFLPGDTGVLFVSDIDGGKPRLFLHDLASGKTTRPVSELDEFEIDGVSISPGRTLLGVVTNEDGYGVPHLYRLPTFERIELPPIERGVAGFYEVRDDRVSWVLNNARTPSLAFSCDVPRSGGKTGPASQVSKTDTQGIDLAAFPLPTLVWFEASKDNLSIPAFLWLPPGHTQGKPIPFVVAYHGGPEGQHRPVFSAITQYLLSEGFGVLMPNVRGSTGYGRAFHMMDDYKKRWDSVSDGVDAAQWLVDHGYATPGKISTYGGSYGGFMSVACIVEDQERADAGKPRLFGAGIDVVGIVNLRTFLEKTAPYRRKLREVEYGPLSDPEFLASVSSMSRVDKIRVPMFIAHGFNDPRVPVEEAMQLAVALKDQAFEKKDMSLVPRLFIAPDEGHGFAKLDNRIYFNERMVSFLKDTIGR